MKLDGRKLELALAKNCCSMTSLREKGVSAQTLTRAKRELDITPATVGRIAKALGVDVTEILAEEVS